VAVDFSDEDTGVGSGRFDDGGAWREPPAPFTEKVDDAISNKPLVALVRAAIAELPEPHQSVVTLRDVEGLSTAEVAEVLQITEANVRVILRRGRSRIRAKVESQRQGGVT
jgi:RNA polymerase sigma-70 factor (ECF subfamily)